jgi:hypothetical protein
LRYCCHSPRCRGLRRWSHLFLFLAVIRSQVLLGTGIFPFHCPFLRLDLCLSVSLWPGLLTGFESSSPSVSQCLFSCPG